MAKNHPIVDSASPARASPARLHLPSPADASPFSGVESSGIQLQIQRERQAHEMKILTMKQDHEVRMSVLANCHKSIDSNGKAYASMVSCNERALMLQMAALSQLERERRAHELKKLSMQREHEFRIATLANYQRAIDETSSIAHTTIRGDAKAPPFNSAEATFKFGGTPAPAAAVLTTATNVKASGFSFTVGNGKKRRLNNDDERPSSK